MLYGQATPGGIVNLVTKRPTGQNVNEAVFKTGSGQRAELGLGLDRKAGGALSWRLAANGRRRAELAPGGQRAAAVPASGQARANQGADAAALACLAAQ